MYSIDYLLKNSNLPGPRGNLSLLYEFAESAGIEIVGECLAYIKSDTSNSPEEFVGMCGILGYAVINMADNSHVIEFLRPYASHFSWRIREAVAMGIQEISASEELFRLTLDNLTFLIEGNSYEQRAVVAGLCEPKLLTGSGVKLRVLDILERITDNLNHDKRLGEPGKSLKKALGYGWSVAIAAFPEKGKLFFERIVGLPGKHIRWIVKENLKKSRLVKMNREWVFNMQQTLDM